MSFLKAIESGKEHRKSYRGSKVFDKTCRNHGSCAYCKGNRLHNGTKKERIAELSINEFLSEV
jgi:excinuclease UvrABC ATPase subunit